jgi:hypothetical protein
VQHRFSRIVQHRFVTALTDGSSTTAEVYTVNLRSPFCSFTARLHSEGVGGDRLVHRGTGFPTFNSTNSEGRSF